MSLQQVLAPQLQQSLALLQAPTLELKALVEQELQQNPVLEESATEDTERERESDTDSEPSAEAPEAPESAEAPSPAEDSFDQAQESRDHEEKASEPVDDFQAEFERLVQLDQEWRDHFAQTNLPMRASAEEEEKRDFMFNSIVADTSLQENLLEQMRLSDSTEEERPIAEMIIGNIDDYGYLNP